MYKHTCYLQLTPFNPVNFSKKILLQHGRYYYQRCHPSKKWCPQPSPVPPSYGRCWCWHATRLDNIHFMTVDTTIRKDLRLVIITQLSLFPQGPHKVTHPNSTNHVTHGCVGNNPMAMPADLFKLIIVDPIGPEVPCVMEATGFGQSRGTLDSDDLHLTVKRHYGRTFHNKLWTWLHTFTYSAVT